MQADKNTSASAVRDRQRSLEEANLNLGIHCFQMRLAKDLI